MNRVVLDYSQEIQAHHIGLARVADLKGRPDHPGRFNKAISLHEFILENAEAVAAEIAVAQYFGLKDFKPTLNTFKGEADVGSRLEVKWTKYDNGSLIINKTDRDNDVAVLVTGRSLSITWLDGYRSKWLDSRSSTIEVRATTGLVSAISFQLPI